MNFDQDYKEFIEHEKTNYGTAGPVVFTIEEDVSIRLFVVYLNCRYAESHLTRKSSGQEKPVIATCRKCGLEHYSHMAAANCCR